MRSGVLGDCLLTAISRYSFYRDDIMSPAPAPSISNTTLLRKLVRQIYLQVSLNLPCTCQRLSCNLPDSWKQKLRGMPLTFALMCGFCLTCTTQPRQHDSRQVGLLTLSQAATVAALLHQKLLTGVEGSSSTAVRYTSSLLLLIFDWLAAGEACVLRAGTLADR